MDETNDKKYFKRSGLAALSDLQKNLWRDFYHLLENYQHEFLLKQHKFRSPEYKWPHDALHNWSRIWEYPYVYYHLKEIKKMYKNKNATVVDLGSGVTFFPFSIAELGYNIICSDIDEICERDLAKAQNEIHLAKGSVSFQLINGNILPFKNKEVDIIYCISVLEHMNNFSKILKEIYRILKPNGFFILTIDLDLRGDQSLSVDQYNILESFIYKYFKNIYEEKTIHPKDILTSKNSFSSYKDPSCFDKIFYILKQRIIKPIVGKTPLYLTPHMLTVKGYVLKKK